MTLETLVNGRGDTLRRMELAALLVSDDDGILFNDLVEQSDDIISVLETAANALNTWTQSEFIEACIDRFNAEHFIFKIYRYSQNGLDFLVFSITITDDWDESYNVMVSLTTYLTRSGDRLHVGLMGTVLLLPN
jgi:hypothetical protein